MRKARHDVAASVVAKCTLIIEKRIFPESLAVAKSSVQKTWNALVTIRRVECDVKPTRSVIRKCAHQVVFCPDTVPDDG